MLFLLEQDECRNQENQSKEGRVGYASMLEQCGNCEIKETVHRGRKRSFSRQPHP